jgi:hypothetical protein
MTRLKTQAANLYSNKRYSDKSLNLFILVFRLLQFMNQKTTFLVLGLTLAIVATLAVAPIVNELAYAAGRGGSGGAGGAGSAGVRDGQPEHGLANACSHPNVAANNPNCGQRPTGAASVPGGTGGSSGAGGAGGH